MSRGSRVFYINSQPDPGSLTADIGAQILALYPGTDVQDGDIAVCVEVAPNSAISTDYDSHLESNEIYQYDGASWSVLSNRETVFSDPNITAHVTKIRRAHMEEPRAFLHFMQRFYGRRYGDTWFNKHDMSGAILAWYSENDYAKAYIANYGADQDYLTFEFGDSATDMIRFVNRTPSSNHVVNYILDITGEEIISYVDALFKENVQIDGTLYVEGVTTHNEKVILRAGDDYGIQWPGGDTKITENGTELNLSALGVDGKVNLVVPDIHASQVKVGVNIYENWHAGNMGTGSGLDADLLDGYHLPEIIQMIPILNTFESAEYDLVPSNATIIHNLGTSPFLIKCFLRCKTADLGWSVDDEVDMTYLDSGVDGSWMRGPVFYNISSVSFDFLEPNGSYRFIPNKATRAFSSITIPSRWKFVFRAYAFGLQP